MSMKDLVNRTGIKYDTIYYVITQHIGFHPKISPLGVVLLDGRKGGMLYFKYFDNPALKKEKKKK